MSRETAEQIISTKFHNLPPNCLYEIAKHCTLPEKIALSLIDKKTKDAIQIALSEEEKRMEELFEWHKETVKNGIVLYNYQDSVGILVIPDTTKKNENMYIPFGMPDELITELGIMINVTYIHAKAISCLNAYLFHHILINTLTQLELSINDGDIINESQKRFAQTIRQHLVNNLNNIPKAGGKKKKSSKKTKYVKYGKETYPLETGSRGGKYIIVNDRKIYLN